MSNLIPAFVVFTNEGFKFMVPANDIKMIYQSKENILVGDVEEEVVKTVVTLCDALGEETAHYVDESFEDCCKILNAYTVPPSLGSLYVDHAEAEGRK